MKLIHLISRVFLAWTFSNFLAHCEVIRAFATKKIFKCPFFSNLSFFFCSHDFIKKYLGEGKVNEALKYGQNGKDCSIYYSQDVCPWDTSAMIKIASKIMTSGNVDFASIATAAASKMIQNSMS